MAVSTYRHTQTSPMRFVLFVFLLLSLLAGWVWRSEFAAWFSMACLASVTGFVWLTMTRLTVRDEGGHLLVQFGPIPLFSTRIRYDNIKDCQATRSRIIDGWGIHYIPGRGWTWSLWGLDCVDIARTQSTIRVGTDDAENLAAFVRSRIHRDWEKEPIATLCLAIRATACLEGAGINTVGELCRLSGDELLNIRHFGETTLQEVRERLGDYGLALHDERPEKTMT